jgi:diaminobutyrate-2-oxoglutarate transaminase
MTAEAIEHYNSLLEGPLADDAIEKLCEGTVRYNLRYGDRPICAVLRPMFVTERQYEQVMRDATLALSAIERLCRALMADGELRAELGLTPDEERLISVAPGFGAPDASGRLEASFDPGGEFHFVEYNAAPPCGLVYGDALSEIFMGMDVMREFARERTLRRLEIRPCVLETLLCCYREWGGRDQPHIAIVARNESPVFAEFEICREYFESRGYPTIIADPNELEYRGGWLRVRDFRINLVYKRVAAGELLCGERLSHPLIRSARDRAACVVNSFRAEALMKKALFALLDNPQYESLFTGDEVEALRRRVPWTRVLREGFTTYGDRRVDLIDFVAGRREDLILKPNGDHGGRRAVLGWQCDDDEWGRAVNDRLGASFIVQERVGALQEPFPTLSGGQITFEDRRVDFAPYTWLGDNVEGAGVRLSAASSNAPAGGDSTTPMLILGRRSNSEML